MAVARGRKKMRRTQISLTEEQFQQAKRIAEAQGISISAVFRTGLECVAGRVQQADQDCFDRMWSIVGMVKNAGPDDARRHDDIIYGEGIR